MPRPERRRNSRFPVIVAASITGPLLLYLLGSLFPAMRHDLDISEAGLGLAIAVFFVASSLSSALVGRAVERAGLGRSMRLATFVSALAFVGIAAAPGFWTIAMSTAVAGLAYAGTHPAINAYVSERVQQRRHGIALGVKQSAVSVALLLAGAAVPFAVTMLSWRVLFVSFALVVAGIGLAVPSDDGAPVERKSRPGGTSSRALRLLAVGFGFGTFSTNSIAVFFVASTVATGISPGLAGSALAGGSVLMLLTRVGLGWRADVRRTSALLAVAGLLAVGVAGTLLFATGSPAVFVPATLCVFIGGGGWTGLMHLAVLRTHPDSAARATGLLNTGGFVGAGSGPLVFGVIAGRYGYGWAWILMSASAAVGIVLILASRRAFIKVRDGGLHASASRPDQPGHS